MKVTANRLLFLFAAVILAGGLSVLWGTWITQQNRPAGSVLGGAFSLIDQNGRGVDQNLLIGRPSLLLFGFTHCPDVCPTKLFQMAQFTKGLEGEGARFNVIFISIDPERDQPSLIKEYLASFDLNFIGLTGTAETIASFAKSWRVFYRKVPTGGDNYTMDHTAAVYLLNKAGQFVALVDIERTPDKAAQMVRSLL